jgi:hypothetical protein
VEGTPGRRGNDHSPARNAAAPRRKAQVEMAADDSKEKQEYQDGNSPEIGSATRIISYNLNEEERPGELKVRFKVRVETGKKAAAVDAAQAEAIKELLQWARRYRTSPPGQ